MDLITQKRGSFPQINNFLCDEPVKMVHHGDYLKALIDEHKPNKTQLALFMGIDRKTLYNMYNFPSEYPDVDPRLLIKAAQFMKHDITVDLPDIPIPRNLLKEDPVYYGRLSLNECLHDKEQLQKKLNEVNDELRRVNREKDDLWHRYVTLLEKKPVPKKNGKPQAS